MKKPVPVRDKYFLRSLLQEIDLYDRKLSYLNKFEEFATPADRQDAEKKLMTKRVQLEKAARELTAAGVEYSPADLPRSFRTEGTEGAPQQL